MITQNIGSEGFKWFFGVVEDRNDPLYLGRVRIRINTVHNNQNTQQLPTNQLPWAVPVVPIISSSKAQVGLAPVGPEIGTTVFGFFADGVESQYPVYFGTLFGIPDNDPRKHEVPELARGTNNLNKQQIGPEPASPFNARYPFNKVFRSESGHVFEVDDTPNFERTHLYHRSGTYSEVGPDGSRVDKIVGDSYTIVAKNQTVFVNGNVEIVVNGNVTLKSNKTTISNDVDINGNVIINGNLNVSNNVFAGSTSLTDHTHPDPQGGQTGSPE